LQKELIDKGEENQILNAKLCAIENQTAKLKDYEERLEILIKNYALLSNRH